MVTQRLCGVHGWPVATGAGRVMADLMSGKPTGIRLEGLTAERHRQACTKAH